MAACALRNGLAKCRQKSVQQMSIRQATFTKNLRGLVIKDKMHTVQLYLQQAHPNFVPTVRRGARHPGEEITLAELLKKLNVVDHELSRPIDIGLPAPNPVTRRILKERENYIKQLKSDETLEKLARFHKLEVSLDEVKAEWEKSDGQRHIKIIAEHYGIFRDLFDGAHFYPRVPIKIHYPYDDQYATRVFTGNHIKPDEARVAPIVSYESEPDSLWTLTLSNLDGHLTDSSNEYLHWFIGNIPGNDVSKGEIVCDYLQPFPARGTGYHRFVFILYKQQSKIDFSAIQKINPCLSLKQRTFKTFDFYSTHQDVLTPASLAFFQSEWDDSVKAVFHKKLNMKEPVFEYEFPPLNVKTQRTFPRKSQSFNIYLDKYRDPQDVGMEILKKRLKMVHPFKPETPKLKFPNTVKVPKTTPKWMETEKFKENMRIGKYRGLDMEIFKPERPRRAILGFKLTRDGTYKAY
ncbi:hypothetical protein CHUAL_011467 [Chamberlinius hualienensis]